MATELEAFPDVPAKVSKYPWDEWFNGKPWQLEAGDDFAVPPRSFLGAARAAAKARGGKLKYALTGEKTCVIQFLKL